MKTFKSVFAEHLSVYLKLRCDLGFRCKEPTVLLQSFDSHVSYETMPAH